MDEEWIEVFADDVTGGWFAQHMASATGEDSILSSNLGWTKGEAVRSLRRDANLEGKGLTVRVLSS